MLSREERESWRCRRGRQVGWELQELMEPSGAESMIDVNNRRGKREAVEGRGSVVAG